MPTLGASSAPLLPLAPGLHFVDQHRAALIARVTVVDGVLDALPGEDKESLLCEYLSHTTKNNARELAEDVLQMARGCQNGGARDDMTVLVAGFWKK